MAKGKWLGLAAPHDPIYKEGWSVAVPWRPASGNGTIETLMAALRDTLGHDDRAFLDKLSGDDRAYVESVLRTEGLITPRRFSGVREEIEYARNF